MAATPAPAPRWEAEINPEPTFASIKWSGNLQDSALVEDLRRSLATLREDMLEPPEHPHRLMTSSIAVSTGLSVGYVIWLVRGGALVGSMLSSMPLWNLVDPLPVLSRTGANPRREGEAHGDDASLENLFDSPDQAPAPPPDATPPAAQGGHLHTPSAPELRGHP